MFMFVIYVSISQHSSWTAWPWELGWMGCPKTCV